MNKLFSSPKLLFTLLMIAAVIAIVLGTYLGIALGMQGDAILMVFSVAGLVLWVLAWSALIEICRRLRRGESAFSPASGVALAIIARCMTYLAVVTFIAAFIGSERDLHYLLIEMVLLPGFFLAAAVAAQILRGLLTHAIAIEKEQEGVV